MENVKKIIELKNSIVSYKSTISKDFVIIYENIIIYMN